MIAHSTDSMGDLDSRSNLAMLEELFDRCWSVIEERSIAYSDDPIGRTGLYSRMLKIRGTREYPVLFEEYVPDHKLISGLRNIRKQISIQTGQRKPSKDTDKNSIIREMEIVAPYLEAGRQRVAQEKVARDAAEAAKKETT